MAINRCKNRLSEIEGIDQSSRKEVLEEYKKMILKIIENLQNSKSTEIRKLLDSCLRGVDAVNWILNRRIQKMKKRHLL
jgi:ribosomal protein S13